MGRFGVIRSDDKVFVGDKIQFDVSKSFVTPDETLATPKNHEVSFDAGVTWLDITAKKKIDYIYSTAGTKTVSLKITTTAGNSIFTKDITALDLAAQKLFSSDSDLYRHEPDIDNLLPAKWSSWNLIHLEVQKAFMDWLDEKRIFNQDGTKYVVDDLLDLQQVRQFSIFKVLELIYSGAHNISGDVYEAKRDKYLEWANEKLSRSQIALDYNGNATADRNERTDLMAVVVRRG
jgi:hypothetical protein